MTRGPDTPLSRAQIQWDLMRQWRNDWVLKERGWTTIYAVDADVFTAYGGPGSESAIKIGRIFETDEPDLSTTIAARLLDYVMFALTGPVPLLIVPPIEQDVAAVLGGLSRRLGRAPPAYEPEFVQQLRGRLDELTAGYDTELVDGVVEKITSLLYFEGGPPQAYRRLTQLLELGRIADASVVSEAMALPPAVRAVFAPFRDLRSVYEHLRLSDDWMKHFVATGQVSARRTEQAERDAQCLARIELWNDSLSEHQTRILYISATPRILSGSVRTPGSDFVRHPRYFMADRPFFQEAVGDPGLPESSASDFYGWISTLVGVRDGAQPDPMAVDPSAGDDEAIARRWEGFATRLRTGYVAPTRVREELLREIGGLTDGIHSVRDWLKVRDSLDERFRRNASLAWEACFRLSTRAMFATRSQSATPARAVVPVYFDSWEETRRFVELVSRWHSPEQFDDAAYRHGIEGARADDPTGYAYYVAHAVLFAGRGEWGTAAAICDHAIAVAAGSRPPESEANGREAHFLAAYCRRHTVRDRSEALVLQWYLAAARRIYTDEKRRRGGLDALPERFDAEGLSIEQTALFFDIFMTSGTPNEVQTTAEDILMRWNELFTRVTHAAADVTRKERVREPARVLCRRISLNHLGLGLVVFGVGFAARPAFRRHADNLLADSSGDAAIDEFNRSYLVRTVKMCASALLRYSRPSRNDIKRHFDTSRDSWIMVFDEQRFARLHEIALASLSRP